MSEVIVKTDKLCADFKIKDKMVRAVNQVSLSLEQGKTLVILGESGSGKSTYMKALLRILPKTAAVAGKAEFLGRDLFGMSEKEFRDIRGNQMAMIYQDSLSALDPMYKVGYQVAETIHAHTQLSKAEARERVEELFVKVGIPSPKERMNAYPHEMSGGMRQRAVIAMALCCNPSLLLADEPTTALDVTIQKQILNLFLELQESDQMSIMMVTHDIGVAAQVADQIAIMYGGIILEYGATKAVLETPANPYTKALIAALPKSGNRERPTAIEGQPPTIVHMPPGCPFSNRCAYATDACRAAIPELQPIAEDHMTACHMNLN